jgi:hypothetical protein
MGYLNDGTLFNSSVNVYSVRSLRQRSFITRESGVLEVSNSSECQKIKDIRPLKVSGTYGNTTSMMVTWVRFERFIVLSLSHRVNQ